MKDKYSLNLVKIRHKSASWFKSYSKNSTDTADLGSGQIAVKEGRNELAGFKIKITFASYWCKFGKNWSIGSRDMVKTVLLRSGQIAVKEERDVLVRPHLW